MCKLSNDHRSLCLLICGCMDFLMIMSAIALAIVLPLSSDHLATLNVQHYLFYALLVAVVCQLCLYYTNLYELHIAFGLTTFIGKLGSALAIATLTLMGLFYAVPSWSIGHKAFTLSITCILCFLIIWRLLYQHIHRTSWLRTNILIIGTDEEAQYLAKDLTDKRLLGYELQGFLGTSDEIDKELKSWNDC